MEITSEYVKLQTEHSYLVKPLDLDIYAKTYSAFVGERIDFEAECKDKIGSVKVEGEKTTLTLADKYTYALAENFDASETGLYKTTDNDGDSYYYRGSVTNNNVKFAGLDWKIIRINGDGSIRMITTNNVKNSQYNSKREDPTYVGYTYNVNFSEDETVSSAMNYYNINIYKSFLYFL